MFIMLKLYKTKGKNINVIIIIINFIKNILQKYTWLITVKGEEKKKRFRTPTCELIEF